MGSIKLLFLYSGRYSFMVTRISSFFTVTEHHGFDCSFLFAFWILSSYWFPERPKLRSYPLSWTAVKVWNAQDRLAKHNIASAANLGTRACYNIIIEQVFPSSPKGFMQIKEEGGNMIWLFMWFWRFKKKRQVRKAA